MPDSLIVETLRQVIVAIEAQEGGSGGGDASEEAQDEQTALLTTIEANQDAQTTLLAAGLPAALGPEGGLPIEGVANGQAVNVVDTSETPTHASTIAGTVGETGAVVGGTASGVLMHGISATAPGDTGIDAGDRVGPRYDKASSGLYVTDATGKSDATDSFKSVLGIPDAGTYFRYSARLAAGNGQIVAAPSGGRVVVRGVRVRSRSDTPGAVMVFFDTDDDGGAFESGVDSLVEDIELENSATARPGSNAPELFERGDADDDLRYQVTGGDCTLFVWGYTLPS